MTEKHYVTTRDIVIPAGSTVHPAPHTIRRGVPYGSILLGVTRDSTSEWTMPLDEGIETGLIREISGLVMDDAK